MEPNPITYADAINTNKALIDFALRAIAELHTLNKTTAIIHFTITAKSDALQITCSIADSEFSAPIKGSNIRDILDECIRRHAWLKEQAKKIPHLTIVEEEAAS